MAVALAAVGGTGAGPGASAAVAASAVAPDTPQQIPDVDGHDGMINKVGNTYYLYGTRYACGFQWRNPDSDFCGFGVWSSPDKVHWTDLGNLFDPNGHNSWGGIVRDGENWQQTCVKHTGAGCFNPRMVQRQSDGVWILWFNAPDDWNRARANAYYALGCNGPAGPCGSEAGGAHGSTNKPNMSVCYDNGDFSIVNDGGTAYIVCTMANQTLNIEQLDQWWVNGVGAGARNVANRDDVESPAIFRSGSVLYMTYSAPNCGYCPGTGASYSYSTTGMFGPWYAGGQISAKSCNGQVRSLSWMDGGLVEWIDQWQRDPNNPSSPFGDPNQRGATIFLDPIHVPTPGTVAHLWCN
ncbi:family 43 glycosylhydrolase [Amycolatopsis mediterranei]|uniref:family 43 glycosylhydrolase n=1 Tax=Amycolatopsis mediterranei TaxID=33910 RepID=UPI00344A3B34